MRCRFAAAPDTVCLRSPCIPESPRGQGVSPPPTERPRPGLCGHTVYTPAYTQGAGVAKSLGIQVCVLAAPGAPLPGLWGSAAPQRYPENRCWRSSARRFTGSCARPVVGRTAASPLPRDPRLFSGPNPARTPRAPSESPAAAAQSRLGRGCPGPAARGRPPVRRRCLGPRRQRPWPAQPRSAPRG